MALISQKPSSGNARVLPNPENLFFELLRTSNFVLLLIDLQPCARGRQRAARGASAMMRGIDGSDQR
jgi:hypothetical protein